MLLNRVRCMLGSGSLRVRLLLAPVFSLVCLVLLGVFALKVIDAGMRRDKERQLIFIVEVATTVLQSYQAQEASGALSRAAAQKAALQTLRAMRYGGTEYLWVNDKGQPYPTMIMHPTVPALDGQVLDKVSFNKATAMYAADGRGRESLDQANLFQSFVRIVGKHGDGFVAYEWPKPNKEGGVSQNLFPKLSYVKSFDAWGWIVGTGVYIDDLTAAYWAMVWQVGGFALGVSALIFAVAMWFRRRILNELGGEVGDAVLAAQRMASGDLVTAVGCGAVPAGSLLAALEGMRAQLETLASAIVRNAHVLSSDMGVLTADASSMGTRLSLQKDTFDEVRSVA